MIHAYPHALTGDHHASGGRHVDSILRWQYKVFGDDSLSQCHHILRCKVLDLAFIKSNSPKVNLSPMTTSIQPHKDRLDPSQSRYAGLTRMPMTLLKTSPADCRCFINRGS